MQATGFSFYTRIAAMCFLHGTNVVDICLA